MACIILILLVLESSYYMFKFTRAYLYLWTSSDPAAKILSLSLVYYDMDFASNVSN